MAKRLPEVPCILDDDFIMQGKHAMPVIVPARKGLEVFRPLGLEQLCIREQGAALC